MSSIFLAAFIVFSLPALANKDTVPFIVKEQVAIPNSVGTRTTQSSDNNPGYWVVSKEKVSEVKSEEIGKIIKSVKDEICKTISEGEFKVWIKGEASGKIIGIGASSESGIEVTVKCIPKK
jgi:hypothetical protein